MNDEIKKKAIAWFEEKKKIRTCDCCGENSWMLSEDIVTTPIFSNSGMIIGGKSYPHVMLICNNCGNTKLFNAVKMGILPPSDKGGSSNE